MTFLYWSIPRVASTTRPETRHKQIPSRSGLYRRIERLWPILPTQRPEQADGEHWNDKDKGNRRQRSDCLHNHHVADQNHGKAQRTQNRTPDQSDSRGRIFIPPCADHGQSEPCTDNVGYNEQKGRQYGCRSRQHIQRELFKQCEGRRVRIVEVDKTSVRESHKGWRTLDRKARPPLRRCHRLWPHKRGAPVRFGGHLLPIGDSKVKPQMRVPIVLR